MSDEAKDKEPKAEKPAKTKPEAPATKPKEKEAPKPKLEKKARLKVTKMTLEQVETALDKIIKEMGGTQSRHARALLDRRAELTGQGAAVPAPLRKAA